MTVAKSSVLKKMAASTIAASAALGISYLDDSHSRVEIFMSEIPPITDMSVYGLTSAGPQKVRSEWERVIRETNGPSEAKGYLPRTELGRILLQVRAEIKAAGIPLLDWDEIDREVADRRGGAEDI